MNIQIIGIDQSLLEEIIEEIGSLSIGRCKPYIQCDQVLYDISLSGSFNLFIVNDDMTICKEDRKITINQCRFYKVVII